jgi:hypothetical protein
MPGLSKIYNIIYINGKPVWVSQACAAGMSGAGGSCEKPDVLKNDC